MSQIKKYLTLLKNLFFNKKCLITVFSILLLSFLTIFILIKNNFSYLILENTFNRLTGVKLELINPHTSFNLKADLNFNANAVNIYNKNKTIKFLEVKNLKLSLKPLSLIFKKINIKNLSADLIKIDVYQDEKGRIELFEILKDKKINFDKNLNLVKLDSRINNVELNYYNNYRIKTQVKVKLNDTIAQISKKKKIFELSQVGTIETKTTSNSQVSNISTKIKSKYPFSTIKDNDLDLDIKLDNFNLYTLNDIAKIYLSKEINSLNGIVNLSIDTKKDEQHLLAKISNLKLILNDKKTIIPYKEDILTNLIFNFNNNILTINSLKTTSNDLDIEVRGVVEKIFSKKPTADININLNDTQLNNFVYLLPDNLIFYNPRGIPTLKKTNLYSTLNGKMNFKLFPLNASGNLKASNIYIPGYPKAYRENDVNIYFNKDKMRVYTRIYTPQNEYVTIDGISNLDNSLYGKYSISSTKNIDLAYAKLYLVPLHRIIGFDIGPLPIMDIKGFGNINIKTQGTVFDAQIFGNFKAHNTKAKMNGLAAELNNADCEIVFNNRDLIFKKIQGKIQNADFILTGKANTKGDVNLNTQVKNITTNNALNIFKNSTVSKPYAPLIKNIAATSGLLNASINLAGTIKDYEDENFINDLLLSGNLNFKNNKLILTNKLKTDEINGNLEFGEKQKGYFDINLNNSKFAILFNIKQNLEKIAKGEYFDFESSIVSPRISSLDILNEVQENKLIDKNLLPILKALQESEFFSKLNIASYGRMSIKNIDLSNIKHKGTLTFLENEKNNLINGNIKFENTKVFLNNLLINIANGKIKISGDVDKFLSKNPSYNIDGSIENINLENFKNIISNIKLNNSILKTGKISLKHNILKLNNINISYDNMPIFINAQVRDFSKNQYLYADFSTILNESTTDSLINPFLVYPLKIKGEIPINCNFKGKSDNYSIDIYTKIPKNSDISFSGANIGDINYNREISGKVEVNKNIATISNLRLIKYITNQNNKVNPLIALKINGQIHQKDADFLYKNFKINTMTPMNVRVLNMIFKKSLLKKGNFECAANLEGNVKAPKITGTMKLRDLDIPLYDTKINNINIDINENFIDGTIFAKNKDSDLNLFLRAENNLKPPYIINRLNIESNKLNILELLNSMEPQNKKADITLKQEIPIKPQDITINNGTLSILDVNYNKINAKNAKAEFDFNKNIFNLKKISFDVAQGNIEGSGKYNLDSTMLNLDARMKDCDSNILTKEFLDLSDQLFGKMNGSITLSAKGLNTPDNIKNIKSKVDFIIYDGKMPKLGSLEYLLRAGNILKNGLLSLSLNNLIQILTPYKTGEFDKISGKLTIGNAEVKDIEILSKGKNLSLYLEGNYDILTNFADVGIYGKLSDNISNVLGTAGNASVKQLIELLSPKKSKNEDLELKSKLEKIPSVESQESNPKYFKAKVLGDINKENYIKSFNWL